MKQLNNNTFRKNSWSRHWEKLCFLKNTPKKIPRVVTSKGDRPFKESYLIPKKIKKKFSLLLLVYFNSSTLMLQISSYIFQIMFSLKKIKKYIHFSVINDFIILFVLRHTCL